MEVWCPSGTAVGLRVHLHFSLIISCRMPPNLLSQPDCNDPGARTLSFLSGSPVSGSEPGTKLNSGKLLDDTELCSQLCSVHGWEHMYLGEDMRITC